MASAMPELVGQSSAFALVGAEETRKLYSILALYPRRHAANPKPEN